MTKVVILGGTFNPVHKTHSYLLEQGKRLFNAEEKYYLINNIPPHKETFDISNKHRIEMLKLQCNTDGAKILDLELKRGDISYTYHTIVELKKCHPNWEIFFLIGQDNVNTLSSWYEIEKLSKLVTFVGCRRLHEPIITSKYCNSFLDIKESDNSSTSIRNGELKACCSSVRQYIVDNNLYSLTCKEVI